MQYWGYRFRRIFFLQIFLKLTYDVCAFEFSFSTVLRPVTFERIVGLKYGPDFRVLRLKLPPGANFCENQRKKISSKSVPPILHKCPNPSVGHLRPIGRRLNTPAPALLHTYSFYRVFESPCRVICHIHWLSKKRSKQLLSCDFAARAYIYPFYVKTYVYPHHSPPAVLSALFHIPVPLIAWLMGAGESTDHPKPQNLALVYYWGAIFGQKFFLQNFLKFRLPSIN